MGGGYEVKAVSLGSPIGRGAEAVDNKTDLRYLTTPRPDQSLRLTLYLVFPSRLLSTLPRFPCFAILSANPRPPRETSSDDKRYMVSFTFLPL